MSVPIRPNWTRVTGVIERVDPAADLEGHVALEIQLSDVGPVEGFANLLRASEGDVIRVLVRSEPTQWRVGDTIAGLVRRAGKERVFAHPREFGTP
jgi:hypothetical protein